MIQRTQDHDVVSSQTGAVVQEATELTVGEVKRRSLNGVFSFVFRTLLLTGVSFAAQIILGSALTPADYGMYGIVVTISSFFTIISDVGLAASLIQKKEEPTTEELRTVFTVQQMLAWVVCVLIVVTSIALQKWGRLSPDGVYLSIAFGLSFPVVSLKTISSILLERKLLFNKLVLVAIVESLVFNILVVPLALRGYGVTSFTVAVFAKSLFGVAAIFFVQRWDIGISFSSKSFFTLMKVGGAFQLNDMLAKAKDDLFYLTLSFVISPAQFGYITWAKQWSRFPYTLTVDNITALTFPTFSRLQHDKSLLTKAIEKTIYMVTLVAFPLLGGIGVMMFSFIHLLPKYEKWEQALFSLLLFSISLMFSAFSTPLISTLNALGKIQESLKMMVFWTISQWVLFAALFRFFGFQSVAVISIILASSSLFVVLLAKRHVDFQFVDSVWRQAVATCIMSILLYLGRDTWSTSFIHFGIGILTGGVIFLTLMIVLGFEKMRYEVLSILRK